MSEKVQRPAGDQLRVLLYNGDLCVGSSDNAGLWYTILGLLIDDECRRLAGRESVDAGEGEG